MSQDASARLSLPYLLAGQLQKHVTLNEALTRLDLLVQTTVQSRSDTAPSIPVTDGSLYIVPEAATAEHWSSFVAGDLVRFEVGHWLKQTPSEGMVALVRDEGAQVCWLGSAWVPIGGGGDLDELQNLTRLGLGTTADANNPFAAKVNKALWAALETGNGGDGDLRFTFNKQSAARVLSLLFQSDWGGRAELGLIGDDDLRLKVSADGGNWHDALVVDRASGAVGFAKGATRRETTIVTANGSWAVPAWARWVEVRCIAGGGGGGAGRGGVNATMRGGGGGGGAGGMATATWPAASLASSLNLTVGAGGTGGVTTAGGFGGNSQVEAGGLLVLRAYGGHGGALGTEAEAAGGYGGAGHQSTNGGARAVVGNSGASGEAFTCPTGPGGGGAGGGVTNGNVVHSGGAGGDGGVLLAPVAGGAVSSVRGHDGASASNPTLNWSGGGGGGGSGASEVAGYEGGAGGLYGAGGGGGGGGRTTGGKGGAGGAGVILITAVG